MAAQTALQPQLPEYQRTKIGEEPVPSDDHFHQLPAGGKVLVLKNERGAARSLRIQLLPQGLLKGAEKAEAVRKKSHDGGEAMSAIGRRGGTREKARPFAGAQVGRFGNEPGPPHHAELIGPPMARCRQLGHGRDLDFGNGCHWTPLGSHSRQRPCGTLVIHEVARPVDRIE